MLIARWIPACVTVIAIIAVVAVSGCLGSRSIPPASPSPPAVLLDYHRTGGIAGVDDRLVIFDNGAALVATRVVSHEFTVNRSELRRLDGLFVQAGFAALQGNYTSARGGADLMRYTITYANNTVITEDSVVPPVLQPVLSELNGIVESARSPGLVPGTFAGIRT